MKIILLIFLCITSSRCGVLDAEHRITTVQLIRVMDYFDYANNVILLTPILIDVTKDKEETQPQIENQSFNLSPGLHKWEVKFLRSAQPVEEINRILNIVEATAKKTGQLISKNCTNGETDVFYIFNINIDGTNQPLSKKHKRDIQNSAPSTDKEEIERLIKRAEADGKCKNVDGALICHVFVPENSPTPKHKRDIEFQNNTTPAEEVETIQILEVMDTDEDKLKCTTNTAEKDSCVTTKADFAVDECPAGSGRADDGTCVQEIVY